MPRPRSTPERKKELQNARQAKRRALLAAQKAERAAAEIADALAEVEAIDDWDADNPRRVAEALLKHRREILRDLAR
jgi:chaperonin cofactor prefoldin